MKHASSALAAAVMAGILGGSAVAADRIVDEGTADTTRSAGEYAGDLALTAKVKAALASDPTAKAHQIDVEIADGIVQLNGFVDSEENRVAAGRVAGEVEGITEVRNNLEVRAEETAGAIIDDTVITAKAKAALIENETTKAHEINVETQDGVVQLSGFVDTESQKSAATHVVAGIEGVAKVQNDIDVKPRS